MVVVFLALVDDEHASAGGACGESENVATITRDAADLRLAANPTTRDNVVVASTSADIADTAADAKAAPSAFTMATVALVNKMRQDVTWEIGECGNPCSVRAVGDVSPPPNDATACQYRERQVMQPTTAVCLPTSAV